MAAEYDVHRKSYKYGLDDWQLLVNILHEYSEKLLVVSRQLSNNKRHDTSKIKGMLSFGDYQYPLLNALRIFLPIFSIVSVFSSFFLLIDRKFTWQEYIIICVASLVILITTVSIYKFLSKLSQRKNNSWNIPDGQYFSLELIEKDARVMSSRLESAIRLTIAVADQVEISLAKKLEMDLRIDEASYALECYYSVSGEKPSIYQNDHKYQI